MVSIYGKALEGSFHRAISPEIVQSWYWFRTMDLRESHQTLALSRYLGLVLQ